MLVSERNRNCFSSWKLSGKYNKARLACLFVFFFLFVCLFVWVFFVCFLFLLYLFAYGSSGEIMRDSLVYY